MTGPNGEDNDGSKSPVPCLTISVSSTDAQRFLDARAVIADRLAKYDDSNAAAAAADDSSKQEEEPDKLHEKLHRIATQHCKDNAAITDYLHRIASLSLPLAEVQASLLLLAPNLDATAKLKCWAAIFGTTTNMRMGQQAWVSLLRSILTGIACWTLPHSSAAAAGASKVVLVVEGRPSEDTVFEPPPPPLGHNKKLKTGEDCAATASLTHKQASMDSNSDDDHFAAAAAVPSFDSSLATLRDEDELLLLRRDVEHVVLLAVQAAFQGRNDDDMMSLAEFEAWYQHQAPGGGQQIVPWLELLDFEQWEKALDKDKTIGAVVAAKVHHGGNDGNDSDSPGSLCHEDEGGGGVAAAAAASDAAGHADNDGDDDPSRTLVSFDFSGSGHPQPLCIRISERNIQALQQLVQGTGLQYLPAAELCKSLLQLAKKNRQDVLTIRKDDFEQACTSKIGLPDAWHSRTASERSVYIAQLLTVFGCFTGDSTSSCLAAHEVDLQEFAVGCCFFCSGNKSSKLATGFEMLDEKRQGVLSEAAVLRYLRSYLTMLVAMSLLTDTQPSTTTAAMRRFKTLRGAVEKGAKWTLSHFIKYMEPPMLSPARVADAKKAAPSRMFAFESFAMWYSTGGFQIAPWLELLDLKKVLSLLHSDDTDTPIKLAHERYPSQHPYGRHFPPVPHVAPLPPLIPPPPLPGPPIPTTERKLPLSAGPRDRVSSLRRHHAARSLGPPPEILFTFPLATHRSLIVLKEDATYVKDVVDQLGMLSMNPEAVWSSLNKTVENKKHTRKDDGTIYIDMETFVKCLQEICPTQKNRKRPAPGSSLTALEELLSNYFQCFDLDQVDSVAIDELMGGLMLLCGGKKSTKLSFAFGIFDTRPGIQQRKKKENIVNSLSGEDLFLFLRSILIVTFSCCRQSLDMTDQMVGRCIADTANMICNDVMRHQWDLRKTDRLNFDEFGQWYNDGGFERAPWLELLDLKKWVLVDDKGTLQKQIAAAAVPGASKAKSAAPSSELPEPAHSLDSAGGAVPPPPPDDVLDSAFFDEHNIMHMDSMDDMDMIFMNTSNDKDDPRSPRPRLMKSWSFSPGQRSNSSPPERRSPLKFHVVTSEKHGGYMLSLSNKRIRHLRRLLEGCNLHATSAEEACNKVLAKATRATVPRLTREGYIKAIQSIVPPTKSTSLTTLLVGMYDAFDRDRSGKAVAHEISAGLTILCRGKKSDKLEFAFELLDKKHRGMLGMDDMRSYIRSFLTVLLCVAFAPILENDPTDDTVTTMSGGHCDATSDTIIRAVQAGADWATEMAFRDFKAGRSKQKGNSNNNAPKLAMSFDDFAEWYTTSGYSSIPWLELLDLRKWVFTPETAP